MYSRKVTPNLGLFGLPAAAPAARGTSFPSGVAPPATQSRGLLEDLGAQAKGAREILGWINEMRQMTARQDAARGAQRQSGQPSGGNPAEYSVGTMPGVLDTMPDNLNPANWPSFGIEDFQASVPLSGGVLAYDPWAGSSGFFSPALGSFGGYDYPYSY